MAQRRNSFLAGAALGIAGALSQPVQAQLLTNGGFEAGTFNGWTTAGDSAFSGVTCPGPGATVYQGGCSAFLGTLEASGSLSQTFATVAGQSYLLSFAVQYDGGLPGAFSANFGNTVLYSAPGPSATNGFVLENFLATATAASTTLTFTFRDDPGFIYLDGVTVAAVPEPETLALLAVGLASVVARRRLLRKS